MSSPAWPPEGGQAGEGDLIEEGLRPGRCRLAVYNADDAEVGGHGSGY